MEFMRIQRLYELLERLQDEKADPDEISALRWAIYELENK